MPDLTLEQLTLLLAVVAGVALLSFLVALLLAARLRKLRRDYAILRGDGEERDVLAAVGRSARRIEAMDKRIDEVVASHQEQSATGRFALQKFALVRYDAFEDMGGQLSFSVAVLDEHGDGLVLTSINGRTETRTYAKTVKALTSDHNLSDEEREAIAAAASGYERSDAPATASRSR